MSDILYACTVDQVGALLRTRTISTAGAELGTFTEGTHPTDSEVEHLIDLAAQDVADVLGTEILSKFLVSAQALVTLRAAMYVELTYFPEQVNSGKSPYPEFKSLFEAGIERVQQSIENDDPDSDSGSGGMPVFHFPSNRGGIVGWRTTL